MELGFQGGFALLSNFFFLSKPCIAWREKVLPFFLRQEEFLIYFLLNVILLRLPQLGCYLLNKFDQPKAKGTYCFYCDCNKNFKKEGKD